MKRRTKILVCDNRWVRDFAHADGNTVYDAYIYGDGPLDHNSYARVIVGPSEIYIGRSKVESWDPWNDSTYTLLVWRELTPLELLAQEAE